MRLITYILSICFLLCFHTYGQDIKIEYQEDTGQLQAMLLKGKERIERKDWKNSIHYLEIALAQAQQQRAFGDAVLATQLLSKAYNELGNQAKVYYYEKEAIALKDSSTKNVISQSMQLLEAKYRTAAKDKKLMLQQLQIAQKENSIKRKNSWLIAISIGSLLLITALVSMYLHNRRKQLLQSTLIQNLEQGKEISQLKAQIRGEEKERSRIARELHDGIASQLMALKLNMHTFRNSKKQLSPQMLNDITLQLDDATRELRKTVHNLVPDILLQGGLAVAVAVFCERTERNTHIDISFQSFGDVPRLNIDIELSLYRIVQELVQNSLKHAQASQILVQISSRDNLLSMAIEDNGIGMAHSNEEQHEGAGLSNIRSRIETLKGNIEIESNNSGTSINMDFNLDNLKDPTICQ